ncbi:flagellar hook-basal body complex protein FliE [Phycisphaera mikurensis]|uniref:Flagellar hook-basal body complex protein FliE n=1 Tax=Phycisphaera mikurensis (strain NBRC 102666 / KCTC 22515 / FYK2301M01) TaxID=1142394 RepID=I0IGE6_PHYMF|nr:flagellar hook-basal body complex protein FliE [Phycisphaera mikurensis]MBB6440288.1 flagellar hook-basal body complex protein FliE [Phycisphaera mikurensis]BAM04334.1 flagellar hook-basal body complex protein FliE [Phycisphaera mikurensis NBRC 102666]
MSDPLGLIQGSAGASPIRPISPIRPPAAPATGPAEGPSFKDVLVKNMSEVSQLQEEAHQAVEDVVAGKRTDLGAVMTATEKADVAFKMLLQVRNKMMDAYEEVKQIRV